MVVDGREVLDRLERERYDVILMDVQMPVMDGLEASRAVCGRWPSTQRPRIIAMTAEAMEGDRERCLAAGMDDYLVKPVRLDKLRLALAECHPVAARPAASGEAATRDAIDREVLEGLREDLGNPDALRQVLMAFLDRAPILLAQLKDATARGDQATLLAAAHSLKGTSATLGALTLSEQCAELERLARGGRLHDLPARVAVIDTHVGLATQALQAEISGASA